jgi:uncharacterized coiled-coil protein SlyX
MLMDDNAMNPQAPAPVESSVPELEQVLVKIQELEQRIGDVELALAKDATLEGHEDTLEDEEVSYEKLKSKVEKLSKVYKEFSKTFKEAEELTGIPEVEKDKKKEDPETAKNADVPQAQTSEIGTPDKTGAPVAGEETGLDAGKKDDKAKDTEAEKDAVEEVPKPAKDYPKDAVQKNALEQQPVKEAPKDPEEMADENGKKPKANLYEEEFKAVQERIAKKRMEVLSGRKSVVGASAKLEKFSNGTVAIKEYLHKTGVRL